MRPNTKGDRKIDTERVVEYLNRSFARALKEYTDKHGRDNQKGTTVYQYEVDFCYLIDSIQRDPGYSVPKTIQEANELIEKLEKES